MSDTGAQRDQPTLTDGNTIVRPWTIADAPEVFAACQDPLIQRYVPVPLPYTEDVALDFVSNYAAACWKRNEGAHLCVSSARGGVLGAIGLDLKQSDPGVATIGYWLSPSARGAGRASGALRLVADWAFDVLGLSRLELEIEPENAASIAVALNVGAAFAGGSPGLVETRGELRPIAIYSLSCAHPGGVARTQAVPGTSWVRG